MTDKGTASLKPEKKKRERDRLLKPVLVTKAKSSCLQGEKRLICGMK